MLNGALMSRGYALVAQLSATPRFAGSAAEAKARGLCRETLERAGFACMEQKFEYSEWPGRWGPPIAAAAQAAIILAVAVTAERRGALPALLLGAALLIALAFISGDVRRRWIARFPLDRASSTNLEATRGTPTVWLVAHLDSKSQTVPMLLRMASSIAAGVVFAIALGALLLQLTGVEGVRVFWRWIAIAAGVAALPSVLCFVRNDSEGAVDNATGVAAVLVAAETVPETGKLGVLITSGEELGLVGAAAWAARASAKPIMINCDTIDDAGSWRCMYSGTRPAKLARAVETTSRRLGLKVTVGRMLPGILADSMAFSARGLESATISRGNLSTLARIHTRRDYSNALTGGGVAEASALLAALVGELD